LEVKEHVQRNWSEILEEKETGVKFWRRKKLE
jgi:hypothetical protein